MLRSQGFILRFLRSFDAESILHYYVILAVPKKFIDKVERDTGKQKHHKKKYIFFLIKLKRKIPIGS